GRIAIIDTPENAARHITDFKAQGVEIVARYYARESQLTLPEKRIAFNRTGKHLESQLLTEAGIGILSVYQYKSNIPQKFVDGLPDTGSLEKEARTDALAALAQAAIVQQPSGSAIYFGVDFNCT